MKLTYIKLSNFRSFLGEHEFEVAGGANFFVGPNNCGKSTIIEALALLLGRDRLIRDLTEHDFFGSDPVAADRISIVATLILRRSPGSAGVAVEV